MDEKIMARCINQEVQVFEVDKINETCVKIDLKVADYSVSPGPAPYHFLTYVQGTLPKFFILLLRFFNSFICDYCKYRNK